MQSTNVPEWVTAEFVSSRRAVNLRVACERCGAYYQLDAIMPQSMVTLAEVLGQFLDDHRGCRLLH